VNGWLGSTWGTAGSLPLGAMREIHAEFACLTRFFADEEVF
jgi:hypothetical protein